MPRPSGRRRGAVISTACASSPAFSTFVFHSLAVFDFNPYYHLKSNTPAVAADVASRLLHVVRMPLFFLIAGMVSFMVLGRGTPQQQMRQRAMRLLPPFLVGIVLFTPFIKYLELADGRNINWRGIFPSAGAPDPLVFALRYFTQLKWFSWAHMWFPLYLFLLGIALLPAMQAIARMRWQPGRHVFVLLTLPLAAVVAIELLLRPFFPVHIPNLFWDWANVAVYVVVMLSGAALVRWPVLEAELQRRVPVMALAGALGVALFLAFGNSPLHHVGRALTLWGCLGVLVGIGPWIARGPRLATDVLSLGGRPAALRAAPLARRRHRLLREGPALAGVGALCRDRARSVRGDIRCLPRARASVRSRAAGDGHAGKAGCRSGPHSCRVTWCRERERASAIACRPGADRRRRRQLPASGRRRVPRRAPPRRTLQPGSATGRR